MNLNKAFIIGNLTRDPELKTLPSGTAVVNFGMATNRIWKDKQGAKQQDVQFHNVVAFGRQAEIVNQYLKKGSLVFIEGRIQTRSWDAADGSKRNRTEIVAERIQLGPRPAQSADNSRNFGASQPTSQEQPTNQELPEINIDEEEIKAEDLPF